MERVLTGKISVTRFFLRMPARRRFETNASGYLPQINIKTTQSSRSINTAVNFFFGLQLKVTEKILFKICEGIQTQPIELTTISSDTADEDQNILTQADNDMETEDINLEGREQSQKNVAECVAKFEPPQNKSLQEIKKDRGKR